jgi:hypothetical protein
MPKVINHLYFLSFSVHVCGLRGLRVACCASIGCVVLRMSLLLVCGAALSSTLRELKENEKKRRTFLREHALQHQLGELLSILLH